MGFSDWFGSRTTPMECASPEQAGMGRCDIMSDSRTHAIDKGLKKNALSYLYRI